MPDGAILHFKNERVDVPEAIFKPSMMKMECAGIHTLIDEVINKVDIKRRCELYENIVLAGGNTKFEGFASRLQKEMTALAPQSFDVKVYASQDAHASWIGGSIMSEITTKWVTRAMYDENGYQ